MADIKVTPALLQVLDTMFAVCDSCSSYMAVEELTIIPHTPYDLYVCSESCAVWATETCNCGSDYAE